MRENTLSACLRVGVESLQEADPILFELLNREYDRQANTLNIVAASSIADPSVLVCGGMSVSNLTTEGYPGKRFHAGCRLVDEIEQLAINRAKSAFHANYANVQPHSGTSANEIVIFSLLKPGDTVLGLELDSGGHLSHGSMASVIGQYFKAVGYSVNQDGFLDYDQVERLAKKHKPKLIICGASSYPRTIDFKRFREIADQVKAYLLADISHIAGLVAGGMHPSPINYAHFTTTSTYKQLNGPRGGLILIGKDYDSPSPNGKGTLADMIQSAVFPFFQGTPNLASISAKARSLALMLEPEFAALMRQIVRNSSALAQCLLNHGFNVLTSGTDNHMILIDVSSDGLTGIIAERALEDCGIIINKNKIPGDRKSPFITSGMRLGTNNLARRKMGESEMQECADLVRVVLSNVVARGESDYKLDARIQESVNAKVLDLCRRFPIPNYPVIEDQC